MEAFVKSEIKNGIATVTFFHPQSNSLPGEILRKLAAEFTYKPLKRKAIGNK